jgi:hypothetical protein
LSSCHHNHSHVGFNDNGARQHGTPDPSTIMVLAGCVLRRRFTGCMASIRARIMMMATAAPSQRHMLARGQCYRGF